MPRSKREGLCGSARKGALPQSGLSAAAIRQNKSRLCRVSRQTTRGCPALDLKPLLLLQPQRFELLILRLLLLKLLQLKLLRLQRRWIRLHLLLLELLLLHQLLVGLLQLELLNAQLKLALIWQLLRFDR